MRRCGARLAEVCGVVPERQLDAAIRALEAALAALDDHALGAVSCAAAASGSPAIALALVEGRIDPVAAATAAHLDELWQAEGWRDAAEAAGRRALAAADLIASARKSTRLNTSH